MCQIPRRAIALIAHGAGRCLGSGKWDINVVLTRLQFLNIVSKSLVEATGITLAIVSLQNGAMKRSALEDDDRKRPGIPPRFEDAAPFSGSSPPSASAVASAAETSAIMSSTTTMSDPNPISVALPKAWVQNPTCCDPLSAMEKKKRDGQKNKHDEAAEKQIVKELVSMAAFGIERIARESWNRSDFAFVCLFRRTN